MLKFHFIVCENCIYSENYVNIIKNIYICYEKITRYIMKTGTDPKTYYEFLLGLACQYFYTPYIGYTIFFIICIIMIVFKYILKMKFTYKNILNIVKNIFITLICLYFFIVFFYYIRFKLLGIK